MQGTCKFLCTVRPHIDIDFYKVLINLWKTDLLSYFQCIYLHMYILYIRHMRYTIMRLMCTASVYLQYMGAIINVRARPLSVEKINTVEYTGCCVRECQIGFVKKYSEILQETATCRLHRKSNRVCKAHLQGRGPILFSDLSSKQTVRSLATTTIRVSCPFKIPVFQFFLALIH